MTLSTWVSRRSLEGADQLVLERILAGGNSGGQQICFLLSRSCGQVGLKNVSLSCGPAAFSRLFAGGVWHMVVSMWYCSELLTCRLLIPLLPCLLSGIFLK